MISVNWNRVAAIASVLISVFLLLGISITPKAESSVSVIRPEISRQSQQEIDASLDVAGVFGRSKGCITVDHSFIRLVAREALNTKVPPRVLAAVIATESQCNQFAVSRRGAIGYTQVMPAIWGKNYDFAGQYNLFNSRDNIHVGGLILADYIKQHGLSSGVQHYLGTGISCADCDLSYSTRVLQLAKNETHTVRN